MAPLPLEIVAGELTPYILLDEGKRVCIIKGRCIPENPNQFFGPVLDWFAELNSPINHQLEVICKIQYFNTASAKYLLEIFRRLEKVANNNNQVTVLWYYELDDEDMKEAGEHFADLVKFPFKFFEVSEEEFDS
jgi:hypothetical protein